MTHVQHAEIPVGHVDEQVRQRDQVVAPAHRLKVHGVDAAHGHVAVESGLSRHLDVVSVFIQEIATKTEVDQSDFGKGTGSFLFVSDEDVVQL